MAAPALRRGVRRARTALLAAALLTVAGAACGSDEPESAAASPREAAAVTVTIDTFDFQPDPLTVEAGTTVTFENEDSINHSVTAGTREAPDPELFEEGVMEAKGDTFELTLDEPGSYAYFCKFHPGEGMTGEIIVE